MKLENWCKVQKPGDWVGTPELYTQQLNGVVTGHPKHTDGTRITTSNIVGRRGDKVVTVSGSEYELGQPRADYEAIFPNSKNRLISTLPEVPSC